MPIGWFVDLTEANSYFSNERLETAVWDAMIDAMKTKAIKNGYNRIFYDPRYSVPTYALATATQLIELKIINAEMSYYLAIHLADEDRRKGLEAQGVIVAGIVKEHYSEEMLKQLPVPAVVDAMLKDYKTSKPFGIVDIDRDEDKSVNTKVDKF